MFRIYQQWIPYTNFQSADPWAQVLEPGSLVLEHGALVLEPEAQRPKKVGAWNPEPVLFPKTINELILQSFWQIMCRFLQWNK